MDPEILKRVLYEFNLFEVDEERKTFRSPYLDRVMKRLEEKWRLNAENGKKGGRPKKSVRSAETPAGKGQKPNETQERRVEENKGISSVVNNSSNTGAIPQVAAVGAGGGNGSSPVASAIVAAGVEIRPSTPAITGGGMRIRPIDEESQRPLQPVESWETWSTNLLPPNPTWNWQANTPVWDAFFSIIGRKSSGCSKIIYVFMARLPNYFFWKM